ncbi:MAG: SDR family oxidoreductase [Candidatus Cloacimonetes bacterium]|nr:SDR family oxidoreductase [Candidatus Cloacimonadota bacterium]
MNTILITGANGNIGSYIAEYYASKGDTLHLLYHKSDERLLKLVNAYPTIHYQTCDLVDLQQVETACAKLREASGSIPEIIIHTSSKRSTDFAEIETSSPELWYEIIKNNLFSVYNLLRVNLPLMKEHDYGRIVLFGSNVSRIGLPKGTAYAVSKAGIVNLVRSVAQELQDYNITINALSPGPIQIDDSHFSEEYREFRKRYYAKELNQIPKKRLAELDDIIHVCDFLTAENSSYISGEEFFVTGGKL